MVMILKRLLSDALLRCSSTKSASAIMWRNTIRKLTVGDKASITRTFTEEDVAKFADLTGDHNPLHLDKDFAAEMMFKRPVVHGVLNLGVVSAVLGKNLYCFKHCGPLLFPPIWRPIDEILVQEQEPF